jgi:hypothetical protein
VVRMAAGGPATFGEPRFIAHRRQCPSINLGSNPCWGPRYIKDPATPTVVAATIFVVEADHAVAIDDDRLISCLSGQNHRFGHRESCENRSVRPVPVTWYASWIKLLQAAPRVKKIVWHLKMLPRWAVQRSSRVYRMTPFYHQAAKCLKENSVKLP